MKNFSKKQNLHNKSMTFIIIFCLLICGGMPATAQAERAPDFTLTDLDGKKFRLKDSAGKPVLLVFSTTW